MILSKCRGLVYSFPREFDFAGFAFRCGWPAAFAHLLLCEFQFWARSPGWLLESVAELVQVFPKAVAMTVRIRDESIARSTALLSLPRSLVLAKIAPKR